MDLRSMARKIAARYRSAALINGMENIPAEGEQVANVMIDGEWGVADITFESGKKIAIHTDLNWGPKTSDEAKTAQMALGLIAATTPTGVMIGARDRMDRKFLDPRHWLPVVRKALGREVPFVLYKLRNVPIELAERFADVGTAASTFPNGRVAWQTAKRYAEPKPFADSEE